MSNARLKNTIDLRKSNTKVKKDEFEKNALLLKQNEQIIALLDELLKEED